MHREVDDPIDIHTFFDGKSRVEGDAVTAIVPAPAELPGAYNLVPPLFWRRDDYDTNKAQVIVLSIFNGTFSQNNHTFLVKLCTGVT